MHAQLHAPVHTGFMVALQIRDVPDSVRDLLTQEARRRDQSLQAYLSDVLAREAAAARNRGLIESLRSSPRPDGASASAEEIVASLAAERAARGA